MCLSYLSLPLKTPTWSTSDYRSLYLPPRHLCLQGVSLHLHYTLSTLSPILLSTPLSLWLSPKTSTKTPGHFAAPPANYTTPAPTASGVVLITCSPFFSYTVFMDPEQPGPPNPFKLFYYIFSTKSQSSHKIVPSTCCYHVHNIL